MASGSDDQDKLAAAKELAQSFKSIKDQASRRGAKSCQSSRQPARPPQASRTASSSTNAAMSAAGYDDQSKLADAMALAASFKTIKEKSRRGSSRAHDQYSGDGDFNPRIPMPSQRHYTGLGKFGVPPQDTNQKPLLGNSGFDFLRRVEPTAQKPVEISAAENPGKSAAVSTPAKPAAASSMAPRNGSLVFQAKPTNIRKGSMLEAFYALIGEADDSAKTATQPKPDQGILIDFKEVARDDEKASPVAMEWSNLQNMAPLSPTPVGTTTTSSPSPSVDISEAKPKVDNSEAKPKVDNSEAKPEVEIRDAISKVNISGAQPNVTRLSEQSKKLCPQASSFVPCSAPSPDREPKRLAEAHTQPNHKRNTSSVTTMVPVPSTRPMPSLHSDAATHLPQPVAQLSDPDNFCPSYLPNRHLDSRSGCASSDDDDDNDAADDAAAGSRSNLGDALPAYGPKTTQRGSEKLQMGFLKP
ncbi:hypothetical protein XA68_10529 [Ophiocordyceps unilateralis]|uniref:Uncharacterized protein n=1 Tax=Ophiocordyceps unilateralis TaxID=268505 RepID=A0A2A9PI40_OPHUN|nr:hypothetical protein XA68_10529 [Ophiocordyceps unilateralis]